MTLDELKTLLSAEEARAEVRAQLRHVREGTRDWEIEYAKVLEQVKRRKGL